MPSLDDLKKLIDLDPSDPFPRYGYAMQLRAAKRFDEAIAAFEDLIARSPDYIPARQQLAMAFEAAGRIDEARGAYRAGIDAARKAGERHAAEEMEGQLGMLG